MGHFSASTLDGIAARGCGRCGGQKILFKAFLDARLPLLGGDVVGNLVFVHDGERFIEGVYDVTCGECGEILFRSKDCPRCHAEGALPNILEATDRWETPQKCPSCEGEEVRYYALAPARALWIGGRVERPRPVASLGDPGFHGFRVECPECGPVLEKDRCPLCDSPAAQTSC